MPGGQPGAQAGAGDDHQQRGQHQGQGLPVAEEPGHASTALAFSHSARRSAWPLSPPLIRRVMAANSPRSANSLRPCVNHHQAAEIAARDDTGAAE